MGRRERWVVEGEYRSGVGGGEDGEEESVGLWRGVQCSMGRREWGVKKERSARVEEGREGQLGASANTAQGHHSSSLSREPQSARYRRLSPVSNPALLFPALPATPTTPHATGEGKCEAASVRPNSEKCCQLEKEEEEEEEEKK
ncbi:hypothetical protein Pcinc_031639 [Petrolisthes cinctipes]|uniref:Uncharacterized protein n=1 Tax=Petrolisthes cinctipes TaxID=88211 RepID=A0AAE1EW05_PETCI|nr:hypothetical protein Pcinc_031639 [Petrolisthes cinctipes]